MNPLTHTSPPPRTLGIWAAGALTVLCTGLAAVGAPPPAPVTPAAPAVSPAVAPDPAALEFFETKIRPILATRCGNCHAGPAAAGKLDVTSRERLLTGGTRGAAIVAGNADESLLIRSVRRVGPVRMPPANALPPNEVADLEAWVKQGAAWPAPPAVPVRQGKQFVITGQDRNFWAYRPVSKPRLPVVKSARGLAPIDRFITAGLEARGLSPAPWADRRTLIRRATFDLTGLAPKPEEIDAFLADTQPGAFGRVIDRLLASPRYGERWGRHWLDVVRYADSNGLDDNQLFPNAYRYRDYVIQAFNEDKPYDQFIKEQLAGDLLPAKDAQEKYQHLIATGFLVVGPKVLREWDKLKLAMDVADEQLDTTSKAFLGQSIACARCHNHKFDPISQQDYYGLAGIFTSTISHEPFRGQISRWHERPLAEVSDEAATARIRYNQRVNQLNNQINNAKMPMRKANLTAQLKQLTENPPPEVPVAMSVTEGRVENLRLNIRGNPHELAEEVPRHFPAILGGDRQPPLGTENSGRLALANWIASPQNPLTARVVVNRLWQHHFGKGIVASPDYFGKLGEKPTHPELLDYLATRLVENGWSLKKVHREIMLSAAYQRSSTYVPTAFAKDPDNHLLWRMNRRRLEAEALRDTLFAVGDDLDLTVGGPTLRFRNVVLTADESTPVVNYNTNRRSVYLPVVRTAVYPLFRIFDYVDPHVASGERAETAVAPQGLFFLNSPFVAQRAQTLAQLLLKDSSASDAQRVELAYRRVLGRQPTAQEAERASRYLRDYAAAPELQEVPEAERPVRAWQSLCQTLFATAEFRYVD